MNLKTTAAYDVATMSDLEFPRRGGGIGQMDLYIPRRQRRPPLVVYLHGGAWIAGSRKDHVLRLINVAKHGIAVASIEHRPAHEAAFPGQQHDIIDAVGVLRSRFGTDQLDTERVALWGASSGAHLAALSALTMPEDGVTVYAVIGMFGRYDLTAAGLQPAPDPEIVVPKEIRQTTWPEVLGGSPLPPMTLRSLLAGVDEADLDDAALRNISPIEYIERASFPILLLHGNADAVTHHAHSERLANAAHTRQKQVDLIVVDAANHEDPWFDGPDCASTLARFLLAAVDDASDSPNTKER